MVKAHVPGIIYCNRATKAHATVSTEGLPPEQRKVDDFQEVFVPADGNTVFRHAAETGHLVLGTLHTTGAVKTIDRVIDALPGDMREQSKSFLAQSLNAVITQTLVRTPDGRGRRAVVEIMLMTRAIAKLIMSGK